jgi:aminoglycoside phosphotransferase (APT) family kinase protein
MNVDLNSPSPIRPGEELPIESLVKYLQQQLPANDGPLTVEQFPHGHSNLTYLLKLDGKEFVLRRPPFGNQVASAHDMGREFRILSRLNAVYPAAPRPELFCDDVSVIGSTFYLMERRHGLILRKTLPAGLSIDSQLARQMSTSLIDNLAVLHGVDYQSAGLTEMGKPEGYVQRQVAGWTKRYAQAQTSIVPAMDRVTQWLNANMPIESGATVIHNDYKYDNVMLDTQDPTKIVAVLDWEMATIGEPLMDLGTSLGYWVEATDPVALQRAAFGPTSLPGSLTRREVIDRYQEMTGATVSNPVFYYCFGLFKLAVIVQQIYARFARGHTTDPRFAHLDQLVLVLGEQSDRTIESGKV